MKKLTKILLIVVSVCLLVGATVVAVSANSPKTFDSVLPFVVEDVDGEDGFGGYSTWDDAVSEAEIMGTPIYLNPACNGGVINAEAGDGIAETYYMHERELLRSDSTYKGIPMVPLTASEENFAYAVDVEGIVLDMNGCTINQTFDGVLFKVGVDSSLTIQGAGTINNARTVATVAEGAVFTLDATGKISINTVAHQAHLDNNGTTEDETDDTTVVDQQGYWVVFATICDDTSAEVVGPTMNFKGDIYVKPANDATVIIRAWAAGSADELTSDTGEDVTYSNNTIIFDSANFVVDVPETVLHYTDTESGIVGKAPNAFVAFRNGSHITVKNDSYLEMNYGSMFCAYVDEGNKLNSSGHLIDGDANGRLDSNGVLVETAEKLEFPTIPETWECTLDVSDSVINSDDKDVVNADSAAIANAGESWGNILRIKNIPLVANFKNTDINGGSYIFDASTSATSRYGNNYVSTAQLTFKDCNLTRNEKYNGGSYIAVFVFGVNYVWEGGSINAGGNPNRLSYIGYYHDTFSDGVHFYGGLFKNVKLLNLPWTYYTAPTTSGGWRHSWSYEGQKIDSYKYVENDAVKTIPCFITDDPNVVSEDYIKASFSGSAMTVDYKSDHTGTKGTNDWKKLLDISATAANRQVVTEEYDAEAGNHYLKLDFCSGGVVATDESDKRTTVFSGKATENKYLVYEFDIASGRTDTKWFDTGSASWTRFALYLRKGISINQYSADGQTKHYTKTVYDSNGALQINAGGTVCDYEAPGASVNTSSNYTHNSTVDLPNNGVWSRFTIVYQYVPTEAETIKLQAYSAKDVAAEGEYYETVGYKLNFYAHIYINGELVHSIDCYPDDVVGLHKKDASDPNCTEADYVTADELETFAATDINYYAKRTNIQDSSPVMIDNIRAMQFSFADYSDYTLPGFSNPKAPTATLAGHAILANMPTNDSPAQVPVIGTVDGVDYTTEAALVAAIKEDSIVDLKADLTLPLGVDYPFVLNTNGFNVPGFMSADYRPVEYTTLDRYLMNVASDFDKIEFTFTFDEKEVKATSVIGTLLNIPDELNPDYVDLYELVVGEYPVYNTLTGWELDIGGNVVTADAWEVEALVESTPAVTVVWNGDYDTPKKEYYNPLLGETLREPEFTNLHEYNEEGWFMNTKYWNEDDKALIDLQNQEGAVYNVNYSTVKEGWIPGVKANLSLYNFFYLNFYVPIPQQDNITVTSVSTDKDGSTLLGVVARNDNNGNPIIGTLDGVPVTRYVQGLGLSDTSLITYYINYTIDDVGYQYAVNYGVPVYAAKIMSDYQNDESKAATTAKSLIMNMVSYTDKLVAKLKPDDASLGGQIYDKLLEKYPEYVTTYADSDFQENGTFYDSYIKDLNKPAGSTATITDGAYYVKEGSVAIYYDTYTPYFIFQYTDAAAKGTDLKGYGAQSPTAYYGSSGQNPGTAEPGVKAFFGGNVATQVAMDNNVAFNYAFAYKGPYDEIWQTGEYSYRDHTTKNKIDTEKYDYYVLLYSEAYNPRNSFLDSGDYHYDTTVGNRAWTVPVKIHQYAGTIDVTFKCYGYSNDTTTLATYKLSVAKYISDLIAQDNDAIAEDIEIMKAFYAFANSAKAFKS